MTQSHQGYDDHGMILHGGQPLPMHGGHPGPHPAAHGTHALTHPGPHPAPTTHVAYDPHAHTAISQLAAEVAHMRNQQHHGGGPQHHADADHRDHHSRHEQERHERRAHREARYEPEHSRRSRRREPAREPKMREFPIGFVVSTNNPVPAGELAEIESKPQVTFTGHRLAVSQSIARFFNIVDIKVGKDSQLAATGEMPAEAFSALAVGTQMELDTAEPGIVITLTVRNTDTNDQAFGAVLYGEVEED